MAKLLKPLVVIVLLVSIAALVIQAAVLFPKRTLIKERTQKLENGLDRVVGPEVGMVHRQPRKAHATRATATMRAAVARPSTRPRARNVLNSLRCMVNSCSC